MTHKNVLVAVVATDEPEALDAGGEVAHPPLEIRGMGRFAIYALGGVHHGLWQL